MIRTIQAIKGFGVFNDFRWPTGLPEFKHYNLIYGWNYSGKTTLSRVFRCFEQKQPHTDFSDAQAQLKADDGTVYHLSAPGSAPVFRVFNSDFVRDNLSLESGCATPILVLGEEDIARQEVLKSKRAERVALVLSKESTEATLEAKGAAIQRALTASARDSIKIPFSVVGYDKTRFGAKVNKCRVRPETYLLDEEQLAQNLSVYRATDLKPAMHSQVATLSSVAQIADKTASLLTRAVTAQNLIPRLNQNPAVERWVNMGRPLHEGKERCQYCGQLLPPNLMAYLAGHFSAAYDKLMAELGELAKEIQTAREEEITLGHRSDFYSDLAGRFTSGQAKLHELLEARKSALNALALALAAKQTKAFTSLECPAVNDPAAQIAAVVEAINETISENNARTAGFDKRHQEAFTRLENHIAASFVRDQGYNAALQEIAELERKAVDQSGRLLEIDIEISALEQTLSEASRGAERINELLAAYFGKDDVRLAVSSDRQFQIVRNGAIAKNLSEGERTAIAFAYFVTRVQDGRHPLVETTVVVDDPVSSLDANHLFNTYALIKTRLAGCRQLFVLTHSFELYNLIREWAVEEEKPTRKSLATWKDWCVYLMKRTDDGQAVLEAIPKELFYFRSEYHYLFSTLYHFDQSGNGGFDCLLTLPNVVRRFMEAFGGIMIPVSTGLKPKLGRLFKDEVERERVWKFINYYSHHTTITRSLTIPDTSECRAVVKSCLKAVRDWNSGYFKDLEAEVN
jgi:wobble nucleotide-excising tRNase